MAYGTKYTIEGRNEQANKTWKAYIKERDYTGGNTDLTGGPIPFDISYRRIGFYAGTDYWNLASSTCTIEFVDDTTGLLSEILLGDDEQYQIVVENTTDSDTEWTGFIVPDSYSYSLYKPDISRLWAVDRLDDLNNIAYASGITPYTGRDDLVGVIADCLEPLNLELGFAYHMMWYPRIGASELDETDDPMINLKVDRSVFRDSDGNPYSCFEVLQQVLISFQLRLYIKDNRWRIEQRKKNVYDSSGSDVYKVFYYDKDGAADSPSTGELTAYKEVAVDTDSTSFVIAPSATGTIPIGSAGIVYYHKTPTDGLLSNTDFEDAIQTTGGSGVDNWRPGGTTPTAVLDSPGILPSFTQGLYQDIIYESTTGFTSVADAIANLNDYVEQTSSGTLEGGADRTLQVSLDYRVNLVSGAGVGAGSGRVYLFIELHVGSYKCYDSGHTNASYQWATSPTTDEEKLHKEVAYASGADQNWTFTTEALDDGGSDITGAVYFKIYAATEDMNTSQQFDSVTFDNVTLTVLDSDEEADTAREITLTYDGNVNRSKPDVPTVVFGDGPDNSYTSRLTVLNSVGTEQNITENWNYLPSLGASGFSLHQFWANQLLREYGISNRKIRATIYSLDSSTPPDPSMYLRFESPSSVLKSDYTWNEISWRPANSEQVLTGSFVEYQERIAADKICTVNIKSGSVALQGINLTEGFACLDEDDFTPNVAPTHVYYSTDTTINKAAITTSGSYTISVIKSSITSGRFIDKLVVAQSTGYIFTKENSDSDGDIRYLTRYALDGTGQTDIASYTSFPGYKLASFVVARVSQKIYCIEVHDTVNGYRVVRRAYDGTLESTLFTDADHVSGAQGKGIGISSDETYLVWRSKSGTNDNFYRHDIAAGTEVDLTDLSPNPDIGYDNDHDEYVIDADYANGFFFNIDAQVYYMAYPAGGGLTEITDVSFVTFGNAMTIDRSKQRIYTIAAADSFDIQHTDYDGNDVQTVVEGGVAITSLDLGFN